MSTKVKLYAVSLDCPDPAALAAFYAEAMGWSVEYSSDEGAGIKGDGPTWIFFQKVEGFQAPRWPSQDAPQQFHLDLAVPADELSAACERAEAAGAVRADTQPNPERWTVFIDPVGHPFCLFKDSGG